MLELIGVDELTQWDVGRQINVDKDVNMVHFSNRPYGYSKNVKVTDGVADVPDMFLTSCAPLRVWAYVGDFEKGYTKIEKIYEIKPKNRPEDYIYTPEEVKTWEKLQSEIGDLSGLETKAKENLVVAINEVAKSGGESYTLPQATAEALGGVKADSAEAADTQPVRIGGDGKLYTAPGADGKSAYQYAVDGGYTGTETEFAEKLATDIPNALPNPNALTFTGAVTGSYDGSAPLSVNIPSGGTDISLGLTSAAVGQIIKVKAIDDTGKPTAWEAADMPSGKQLLYRHNISQDTVLTTDSFDTSGANIDLSVYSHLYIRGMFICNSPKETYGYFYLNGTKLFETQYFNRKIGQTVGFEADIVCVKTQNKSSAGLLSFAWCSEFNLGKFDSTTVFNRNSAPRVNDNLQSIGFSAAESADIFAVKAGSYVEVWGD